MSGMKVYERFNRREVLENLHVGEAVKFVGWAELATRSLASQVGNRCGYKLSVHRFPDDGAGRTVIGVHRGE